MTLAVAYRFSTGGPAALRGTPTRPRLDFDTWAPPASGLPAEPEPGGGAIGANLEGRGHSFMAGSNATTAANRYFNITYTALSSASPTNNGVGGSKGVHVYSAALPGNSKARTPGASGLILWDCVINEIITTQFSADAQHQRRMAASLRSFLRLMRASAVTAYTDGSVTFTGASWVTQGGLNYDGINTLSTKKATTNGDKVEIAGYTGTSINIGFLDFESTGPIFTVGVGGVVYGTYDRTAGYGLTSLYSESLVTCSGMPAGSKTVEVILTGGTQPLYFTRYCTPDTTPPSVLLIKGTPENVYNTAGGNYTAGQGDATLAAMNASVDTIAAESEFGGSRETRTCDPGVGWNTATMIDVDTIHPNNTGHAHYGSVVTAEALLFPARAGLV
jgi:hypothetical protein